MLKIKNNINLKKLEKFGFKDEFWYYVYYPKNYNPQADCFSAIYIDGNNRKNWPSYRVLSFELTDERMRRNDLEQLGLDLENIQYSYNEFKKVVEDLKKANLVEEVDD